MLRFISKVFLSPGTVSSRLILSEHYATDTLALGKSKKKAAQKLGGAATKVRLAVETDTNRLVNYVCGTNLLKEGGEDIKIGPDSDYPDWLWGLYTGPPKKLHELDPNTLEYWKKVRKAHLQKQNKLSRLRKWH